MVAGSGGRAEAQEGPAGAKGSAGSSAAAEITIGVPVVGSLSIPTGDDDIGGLSLDLRVLGATSGHWQFGGVLGVRLWNNDDTDANGGDGSTTLRAGGVVRGAINQGGLSPYLQAGLGLAYQSLSQELIVEGATAGGDVTLIEDTNGFGLMYELSGGVRIPLGMASLVVDLGLRGTPIVHRTTVTDGTSSGTSERTISVAAIDVSAGVSWPF